MVVRIFVFLYSLACCLWGEIYQIPIGRGKSEVNFSFEGVRYSGIVDIEVTDSFVLILEEDELKILGLTHLSPFVILQLDWRIPTRLPCIQGGRGRSKPQEYGAINKHL